VSAFLKAMGQTALAIFQRPIADDAARIHVLERRHRAKLLLSPMVISGGQPQHDPIHICVPLPVSADEVDGGRGAGRCPPTPRGRGRGPPRHGRRGLPHPDVSIGTAQAAYSALGAKCRRLMQTRPSNIGLGFGIGIWLGLGLG
jgi:hypothetical protein